MPFVLLLNARFLCGWTRVLLLNARFFVVCVNAHFFMLHADLFVCVERAFYFVVERALTFV